MPFKKGHKPLPRKPKKKNSRDLVSFQKLVEKKYGIDRDEQIAVRLEQMHESHRKRYLKAVNRKSMRAAINSFCLECVGYMRNEVSVCTDLACPLYLYRPYQKRRIGDDMQDETQPDVSQNAV